MICDKISIRFFFIINKYVIFLNLYVCKYIFILDIMVSKLILKKESDEN